MVNYQNSFIYKLCCKNTTIEDIYIGSTTNFKERKRAHKTNCNNENNRNYNINVYKFIRNHGGFNNWDMILIEKVKCNDKMELCKIEREYIEKSEKNLNSCIPASSRKETCERYRKNNRENIKEINKIYYGKNKDIIEEKAKKKITCCCGSIIRKDSLTRHNKSIKHQKYLKEKELILNV